MASIHENTHIGDVKLTIRSLERSLQFYCDVIGFQVLQKTDRQAQLTADGQRALLILEENPSAVVLPERSVAGLYHFAILLPNRKELGMALARLIEHGIAIGHGDHAVSEALYRLILMEMALKCTLTAPAARGSVIVKETTS